MNKYIFFDVIPEIYKKCDYESAEQSKAEL